VLIPLTLDAPFSAPLSVFAYPRAKFEREIADIAILKIDKEQLGANVTRINCAPEIKARIYDTLSETASEALVPCFPLAPRSIDYDSGRIFTELNVLRVRLVGNSILSGHTEIDFIDTLDDYNGISGSPVFETASHRVGRFLGIVTRASQGKGHFLNVSAIREALFLLISK
jgi:hypothetical protein